MTESNNFLIRIPILEGNSAKEAENFLNDLHRQLLSCQGLKNEKLVSFEIAVVNRFVHFLTSCNKSAEDLIAGQIYAHFPGVEIEKTTNFVKDYYQKGLYLAATQIQMEKSDLYPIKTYPVTEIDSLLGLSGISTSLSGQEGIFIKILLLPVKDNHLQEFLRSLRRSVKLKTEPTGGYQGMISKFEKLYFKGKIITACVGSNQNQIKSRISQLVKYFDQFDNDPLNGFRGDRILVGEKALNLYLNPDLHRGYLLNTEEVASIFHFPSKSTTIANVIKVSSRKAEPPENLPRAEFLKNDGISTFGLTNFRNSSLPFGIKRIDRRRHTYILGKTGVGKSKLLELLILSDIVSGKGFAVLDPHGDLAENILKYIPRNRIADVIYFNPADEDYPIGFNPLSNVEKTFRQHVVTGFVGIFKKLFAFEWSPRLEHMLRFTVLALLDVKNATVVSIINLLTNKGYRQDVIQQIDDQVVKNFWTHEFATWNEKFDNEAIVPLLNKVGEFISSPLIRNCLGQKKSTFSISEVMNKEKILIINLSSGLLGEDNSALLGSMIVTQLQQAAMARAKLPEEERKDFYLYVDEFQNFATSAFADILSEARKYRLCLTMAHQYIAQLPEEVKKTVFGNVGTICVFRAGSDDASFLQTEFTPTFNKEDIQNLDSRQAYVKMSLDGKTAPPFSFQTITLPEPTENHSNEIIAYSRANYSRTKDEVEKELEIFETEEITQTKVNQTKPELIKTTFLSNGTIFQSPKEESFKIPQKEKKEITNFEKPII